jgi:hypothetical protein
LKNIRKTNEPFLEKCLSLFGEENGLLVYEFYRYALHTIIGGTGSQSSKRLKHLLKLLEWAPQDLFLKAVVTLNDRFYGDTFKKKMSEQYFRTTLERIVNGFSKIELQNKTISNNSPVIQPKEIIPKQYKRIRNDIYATSNLDYLNYDYECTCGKINDPWVARCTCGNTFNLEGFNK